MRRPISALLTTLALIPTTGLAAEIHVPGDAPTIQIAIDSASPGDEVVIAAGTYAADVGIVNRSNLVVRGEGKVTIASHDDLLFGLYLSGSTDIRIENVRVDAVQYQGVVVEGCQDVQLVGVTTLGAAAIGVWVRNSVDVTLHDCRIENSAVGVHAESSVTVSDGAFLSTDTGVLLDAAGSSVLGSSFKKCGHGLIRLMRFQSQIESMGAVHRDQTAAIHQQKIRSQVEG